VLALVMQGSDEFSDLMLQTKLSKTALANHLKHLMRMGLVKRIARGKYSLTVDGRELLNAATTVKNNKQRSRIPALLAVLHRGDIWIAESSRSQL